MVCLYSGRPSLVIFFPWAPIVKRFKSEHLNTTRMRSYRLLSGPAIIYEGIPAHRPADVSLNSYDASFDHHAVHGTI